MQESFSKAWQNLDRFQYKSAYSTWMYRITVNTCLMHIRSNKKFNIVTTNELPETPEEEYDETAVNTLYKSIQQLTEVDRVLISMVLEDISYKEIGAVMGISENNIGVKVYRIKKELKNLMSKEL